MLARGCHLSPMPADKPGVNSPSHQALAHALGHPLRQSQIDGTCGRLPGPGWDPAGARARWAVVPGGIAYSRFAFSLNSELWIQQALDCGADGILIPYINTAAEAKEGISCCKYPTEGTRSVYFPQRATNKKGLLGYVGNANDNVMVALQVRCTIVHPSHRIYRTPAI